MIRILYVVDSLMAGGIESQLVELVTRLDRTRFDPHIFCLYGPHARELHFAPQVRAAGIPLYTPDLGTSTWDKMKAVTRLVSTVRVLRPHLIQAEGYHANFLMRLASVFFPRRTVLIGSVRGLHTAKQLFYERVSHRVCKQFVVNAPQVQKMLEMKASVPASKIHLILNGIALERFAGPHDGTLRQRIAPDTRRVFVSLGRISFEKNMHWLAEGFGVLKRQQRLPADVQLFIVGPIQEIEAQHALEKAIHEDALEAQIIQHPGTVYPEDYYHACDVCILYSPAEGLPNVCIESLAAGRPVLISEPANAAGVIEHRITGWVVSTGERAHLAEALYQIITMSDVDLAQMRAACLRRAQDFSAERLVQHYMDLYEGWCSPGIRYPGTGSSY